MDTGSLWIKIEEVLERNGIEQSLDGIAILMNSAANADLYTGRYLRAVIDGRATLSPQFLLHSRRAFSWTDEEMAVIRDEIFRLGQRMMTPKTAPPPSDSPIRARILQEATPSLITGSILLLLLGPTLPGA